MRRLWCLVLAVGLALSPPTAGANDQPICFGSTKGSTLRISTKGSPKPWFGANVVCNPGPQQVNCRWCMQMGFLYLHGGGYQDGGSFFTPKVNLPVAKEVTLQCGQAGTVSLAPMIGSPRAGSWIVYAWISEPDCALMSSADTQSSIVMDYVASP